MKIVLIQPPIRDFYQTEVRLQPAGLGYLKAALRREFPEATVLVRDYHHGRGRRTIPVPEPLAYLRDYYVPGDRSPFCGFGAYSHYGADFDEVAEDVLIESPDLVGISALFSTYASEALACAQAVKRRRNVPVILGGSAVGAQPERMLSSENVDFVVVGEGESAMVEFVRAWRNGKDFGAVPGLGFKEDGRLRWNIPAAPVPIGGLAPPDYSDFDLSRYLYEKQPMCVVVTSRGCPYRCRFCSVHQTWQGFRQREPGEVLDEIRARYAAGFRVFDFEDDNLTYGREFILALCRGLVSEFPLGSIRCLAMNGISYWNLDREILESMRAAGFTHLNIALVSSNDQVLKRLERPHDPDRYRKVIALAHALGFAVVSYQILGLPHESPDSIADGIALQASLPVLIGASPFYLVPGTPIESDVAEPSGEERNAVVCRLTAMGVDTGLLGRGDVYTFFITIRILNFLKSLSFEGESISWGQALARLKGRDPRSRLGAGLLEKLFEEGILYAAVRGGLMPLKRFSAKLFFQCWQKIDNMVTLEGRQIEI
ncbi:MAG: radical SAM protein [Candidatus Omnitrophota bacterium]|jgi:radical SAM superfamily enzyme YgiQ (UPF0313 family)